MVNKGRAHAARCKCGHSHSIAQAAYAFAFGAMLAAEKGALSLEAVTDNTDAAMRAGRRQRVDRAFEAVVSVSFAAQNNLKSFVIIVAAGLADCHDTTSCEPLC